MLFLVLNKPTLSWLFSRYKDYRDPPWESEAYTFSKQYWSLLAAKLAFVIFFQVLDVFILHF